MTFRYKMEDLKKSDKWLLLRIIEDRRSSCTNIYSPLYKRLSELQNKISNNKKLTGKIVAGTWMEEVEE